jgi:two-component system phosphate regulon response regulator PhoB
MAHWRVLVADDDMEICSLIATILRRGPYALTICNDAESALVHIGSEDPFDVIICDFMLPGISGIELIARVRANARSAGVPIVMISGHSDYEIDACAKSAGANAFLNKPFSLKELQSTVQGLLDGSLSAAASQ